MSVIRTAITSGDTTKILDAVSEIRAHLKVSLPFALKFFVTPDFPSIALWLITQSPALSCAAFPLFVTLFCGNFTELPALLLSPPICDYVIASALSTDQNLSASALRLISVLASAPSANFAFLLPATAPALSRTNAKYFALFVYRQIAFLPKDHFFFDFISRFRTGLGIEASSIVLSALQTAIAAECEPVIDELLNAEWLAHIRALMHDRHFAIAVTQGFEIAAALLPWMDREQWAPLFDLDLISQKLAAAESLASHLPILRFLERLIVHQPIVIQGLLERGRPGIGVVDHLLGLAENDKFEIREAALDVFIAIGMGSSAQQIRQLSPNDMIGLFLEAIPDVTDEKCERILHCIGQVARAFAQVDGDFDIATIFLAHDGPQVLEELVDSDSGEVAALATHLLDEIPVV